MALCKSIRTVRVSLFATTVVMLAAALPARAETQDASAGTPPPVVAATPTPPPSGPARMVGGHVPGVPVPDRPRLTAERVPGGRPAAILGHRTLDLVRRGGHAPREPGRERRHRKLSHPLIVAISWLGTVPGAGPP